MNEPWSKSIEQSLDEMLANETLPFEAQPLISLAYATARKLDQFSGAEGFSPLANTLLKQIQALREWIVPPSVADEDPFDALARALGGQVADDGTA